ncbi:MAG: hypothetical protein HYR76_13750 [Ignavibacteria bacterium]|nr:hypothetical protein [Ignavibacteria bacterium]
MKKQQINEDVQSTEVERQEERIGEGVAPMHFPITPFSIAVSGLYEFRFQVLPHPFPAPISTGMKEDESEVQAVPFFLREELRLDVDHYHPQMVASGTIFGALNSRVQWIAHLQAKGTHRWIGTIWYKDGNTSIFPYTHVEIKVTSSWFPGLRSAAVSFSGGAAPKRTRIFRYTSPYFHPINLEFDYAQGVQPTTVINTCAHPNHPATLPCENLSVQMVFQRAGFNATTSAGGGVVPIALAGGGIPGKWSDQEMHDAMQSYWSRFANRPQWALWAFFASLHEQGSTLGGIMFDDIGPNHRQGTAIFKDSFISTAPAGDLNPQAWVERMIFWTACHEIGHCFNLAHSWQKSLPVSWIPLVDNPQVRSFMNYPYRVTGGQTAFFSDFEYRFSDQELFFLRHAPERFVEMGNANWFDHHAFQQANVSAEPAIRLEVRVNREQAVFEFMEPVTLELKLTNTSSEPQLIEDSLLRMTDAMTVILKKEGKTARQWLPYVQQCIQPKKRILMPSESIYESLFVSAGKNGWDIAEPGMYTVQIALHLGEEDIVSNQLRVRVTPPPGYDEEVMAQDLFSDEIGRILAFDGSRFFQHSNDILREIAQKLSNRRIAHHANLAVGHSLLHDCKLLAEDIKQAGKRMEINIEGAKPEEARKLLVSALIKPASTAVESFGHIDFKYYVERFSDWLNENGHVEEAIKTRDILYDTMKNRKVHGHKVKEDVLEEISRHNGKGKIVKSEKAMKV